MNASRPGLGTGMASASVCARSRASRTRSVASHGSNCGGHDTFWRRWSADIVRSNLLQRRAPEVSQDIVRAAAGEPARTHLDYVAALDEQFARTAIRARMRPVDNPTIGVVTVDLAVAHELQDAQHFVRQRLPPASVLAAGHAALPATSATTSRITEVTALPSMKHS